MVPQLLPPVAATTIGTPTQKAPSDRNPAAAACTAAAVFTLYPVPLACCLYHSEALKYTPLNTRVTCKMYICTLTKRMGTDQVNREKTRCQLEKWNCPGRGGQARQADNGRFSPNTRAGLGEWLFKTLGSFYFTIREVNSVLKCQSK